MSAIGVQLTPEIFQIKKKTKKNRKFDQRYSRRK